MWTGVEKGVWRAFGEVVRFYVRLAVDQVFFFSFIFFLLVTFIYFLHPFFLG